jgi:hypothetical protein
MKQAASNMAERLRPRSKKPGWYLSFTENRVVKVLGWFIVILA